MPLRVGIDLVRAASIALSIYEHGDAYLERVFTAQEVADCKRDPLRLAARFAAKEATIKALSLSEAGLDWREIEVVRHDDGRCSLALHGKAAAALAARKADRVLVCLSHDGDYAAAVVAVLSDT